jgi:hypothetical protein
MSRPGGRRHNAGLCGFKTRWSRNCRMGAHIRSTRARSAGRDADHLVHRGFAFGTRHTTSSFRQVGHERPRVCAFLTSVNASGSVWSQFYARSVFAKVFAGFDLPWALSCRSEHTWTAFGSTRMVGPSGCSAQRLSGGTLVIFSLYILV